MKKVFINTVILVTLFIVGISESKYGVQTDIISTFLTAEVTENETDQRNDIAQPDDENGMNIPFFYPMQLVGNICIISYSESTIQTILSRIFQPPR